MAVTETEIDIIEPPREGTSWGAIIAGAVAAIGVTLILIVLGAGLGFASVSPWYSHGRTLAAVGIGAVVWLVIMQWIASAIGGYIAGRLRTAWAGIHTDEVYFRDTAHGFLAWCLASVVGALLLAAAGSLTAGGVAAGAGAQAGKAAHHDGSGSAINPAAYYTDLLFRPQPGAVPSAAPATDSNAASGSVTAPATPGMGNSGMGNSGMGNPRMDWAARSEASRILMRGAVNDGGVADADKAYLAQLVALHDAMSPADAQTRVNQVLAQMKSDEDQAKAAADAARKAAAKLSIVTALAMVVGAFIAAVSGAYAGGLRDRIES